jgi:hypothetical protein
MRSLASQSMRDDVAALAHAIRPYVDCERGPTRAALELARNAIQVIDEADDVAELVASMIEHRVRNGWMSCGDIGSAAACGARALAARTWLRGKERAA